MKKRCSGIELLRIITMIMIILIHAFLYGKYYDQATAVGGAVEEISTFIRIALRPAVNIFILISGYFMVHSEFNFKKTLKRTLNTYSRIWFYAAGISLLFLLLGSEYCKYYSGESASATTAVLRGLFPVTSQVWYYFTNYLILCLLSPFINIVLKTISKKDYIILLIISTAFMSIFMTLLDVKPFSMWFNNYTYDSIASGKSVFSFIYLYLVGGYLGLYAPERKKPRATYLLIALACVAVNYILYTYLDKSIGYRSVALNYSNPFVILQGIFMLLFFKDLHFHSKIINIISSTTLGVYAIHEHFFVRTFLWTERFSFKNADCTNIFKNLIMLISVTIIIFAVCAVIDILVQQLFKIKDKLTAKIMSPNK